MNNINNIYINKHIYIYIILILHTPVIIDLCHAETCI